MGLSLRLLNSSCMRILMITDFEDSLNGMIDNLALMNDDDLTEMFRLVERSYIHVLVEQGLRLRPCSVSQIA